MIFLGIDPGVSGGIAWHFAGQAYARNMPATTADLVEALCQFDEAFAMVEKVHSMPGQGVASTFKFGRNYGEVLGCLAALAIPYDLVAPGVWQKHMGCLTRGNKQITKCKAQQLWPDLKITHATADALLIADYGRRVYYQRYGHSAEGE